MRKIAFLILMMVGAWSAQSQTPEKNLEKYWHYRDRLRQSFIVVSQDVEEEGVNIPAGEIYDDTVSWSDGNSIMSHYLAMLSTELYLLKINGQDYSQTLAELYYAMLAMERLDLYSESHWRRFEGKLALMTRDPALQAQNVKTVVTLGAKPVAEDFTPTKADINGMHLRFDITQAFWNKHNTHFGCNEFEIVGRHPMEEISQDVMIHNIEGLSLVARLVGTENVANVPVTFRSDIIPQYLTEKGIKKGDNIDFTLWVGDIISRYVACFQSDKPLRVVLKKNNWVLRNTVTGEKVQQGSGDIGWDSWLFYNNGLLAAGCEYTSKYMRHAKSYRRGDWMFQNILTEGFNSTVKKTVLKILAPGYDRRNVRITVDVLTAGVYELHILLMKGVAGICNLALGENNDDYKVRSLACTSNYLGDNTYKTLVDRRSFDPCQSGQKTVYEHFPLMSLALNDLNATQMPYGSKEYAEEKAIYESLLNSAPFCGPTGNCKLDSDHYAYDWSETSRCVWPENLRPGKWRKCNNMEFNGLDYMMLYNLYMIAFSREQYADGVSCQKPIPVDAVDGSLYRVPESSDCGCDSTATK